jgi:ABC-2 type transport system ATP-binding protein
VHDVTVADGKVRLSADATAIDPVLKVLAGAGVRSLVSQPPTLEELFLRHYETPAAGTPASEQPTGVGR